MGHGTEIREQMNVITADGTPVGTVVEVQHHRIKLAKTHAPGTHGEHNHFVSLGLIAGVEGDTVRLSVSSENVSGFLEEETAA